MGLIRLLLHGAFKPVVGDLAQSGSEVPAGSSGKARPLNRAGTVWL